jgi:hypothetical protein
MNEEPEGLPDDTLDHVVPVLLLIGLLALIAWGIGVLVYVIGKLLT